MNMPLWELKQDVEDAIKLHGENAELDSHIRIGSADAVSGKLEVEVTG